MKKIELEKQIKELKEQLRLAEYRANYLYGELAELAQGIGVKAAWHKDSSPWSDAMQNKATIALKKVFGFK